MNREEATVIVAVFNAVKPLELAVRSLFSYHPQAILWAWDNGSSDGAMEYAQKAASRMFYGDHHTEHGYALDEMAKQVQTEFTVTMDSDVEFTGAAIDDAIAALRKNSRLFCVCLSTKESVGISSWFGYELVGQPRLDPAFAVFRTKQLQAILSRVSFCLHFCFGQKRLFDVGAMIYAVDPDGVLQENGLWDKVIHYGGLSTLFKDKGIPDSLRKVLHGRMDTVIERLKLYGR